MAHPFAGDQVTELLGGFFLFHKDGRGIVATKELDGHCHAVPRSEESDPGRVVVCAQQG